MVFTPSAFSVAIGRPKPSTVVVAEEDDRDTVTAEPSEA